MILVTPAFGTQGRLLLPKPAAAGAEARALRLGREPTSTEPVLRRLYEAQEG